MLTSEVKSYLRATGKAEYRPFLFEENDTFKRRSEDAGAGNAYNPESLFHGSEDRNGLHGERDWRTPEDYIDACTGKFGTAKVLTYGPRTVKPANVPRATFTLTIGPIEPVEPGGKRKPFPWQIRATDAQGREVTELSEESADIQALTANFAWVVRQWQGAQSKFGQHMKQGEDAKMARLRELTEA